MRTVFHCPRCAWGFRRDYVPAAALKDARAERDRMIRLWNRLEAAVTHHKRAHEALFVESPDAALWKVRDKVLADYASGKG